MKNKREMLLDYLPDLPRIIVSQLVASGESLLDEKGVDAEACKKIADDIIDALAEKVSPPRVLITVEGGVVTDIVCDQTVCVKIKDFDTLKETREGQAYLDDVDCWEPTTPLTDEAFDAAVITDVEEYVDDRNQ